MKFSLILPTRKRPDKLERLFNSIEETMSENNEIEVVIWIDDDDEDTINYIENIDKNELSFKINYFIKERNRHIGKMYNFLWEHTNANIYQMINDDIIYETNNWDKEVVKEINKYDDKVIFIWGWNKDTNFPNHFFTTNTVTDILGYFCWRDTPSGHSEKWIFFIFKMLNSKFGENRLVYRRDIKIPHLSPLHSDTEEDEVWREKRKIYSEQNIDRKFRSPKNQKKRAVKAKKLKKYIDDEVSKNEI